MSARSKKVNDQEPWWPTTAKGLKSGGRILGTGGSVWLYAKVPLSPVTDARSPDEALAAGEPLRTVLEEIAGATHVRSRVARRMMAKSSYREVHILLVNVPSKFVPPRDSQLFAHHSSTFADTDVLRRVLLVGVKLRDKVGGGGGIRAAVDSMTESLMTGGVPLEDFDQDFAAMSAVMARSGLLTMTLTDFNLANAWWNGGTAPDTPTLIHDDHLHVFSSTASMHAAKRLIDRDGDEDCQTWDLANHHTLCFSCVKDFDIGYVEGASRGAQWASALIESGAVCVSIRGKVEPAAVTRNELRSGKKKYMDDVNERYQQNKMSRGEQEETLAELDELERYYATGGPATLMDTSTVIATSGTQGLRGYDMSEFAPQANLNIRTLVSRQNRAMKETYLASAWRTDAPLNDLPSTMVAASGLAGLSTVGDRDGALLGFTENDRQPAYMSPTAAADEDSLPIGVVVGQSGSGKSLTMLYLADQFARIKTANGERTPVIIIDPKALALTTAIPTPDGWKTMGDLKVGDHVYGRDGRPCSVIAKSPIFEKPNMYEVFFDDGQVIKADARHLWSVTELITAKRGNAVERRKKAERCASAIEKLTSWNNGSYVTVAQLLEALNGAGCDWWSSHKALLKILTKSTVSRGRHGQWTTWKAGQAITYLMDYLKQCAHESRDGQRVLTTQDMVDQGVTYGGNAQARFAIEVAAPFDAPHFALPIDPYVLGVWLGDGKSAGNEVASSMEDVSEMVVNLSAGWPIVSATQVRANTATIALRRDFTKCLYGHSNYKKRPRKNGDFAYCADCRKNGHELAAGRGEVLAMTDPSFIHLLREVNLYQNKHIPVNYLHASVEQRMALLQGLMDTDGTVEKSESCRLALTNRRLIDDALELIRGLGYKATFWEGDAKINHDGVLRRTGPAYYINFKTTDPVFRLKRKLGRLPTSQPKTSSRFYIQSIEPCASEPAQCIVVDSPDHTYLAAQFIPTHNSGSDHSAVVEAAGGSVSSLDDLLSADGIFDPLRFSKLRGSGAELAASMLMSINPWGDDVRNYEMPVQRAIAYGVDRGADCIGAALTIARDDGVAPKEMVDKVLDLAISSPMFRACVGSHNGGQSLRASEGITLIKVGDATLDLPAPGTFANEVNLNQRVALALVRMMVFGSASALAMRSGVLMLDEAWVMLGAGRSEMERLGRLARSQQVYPMLFTQRITDALDAGLAGYISRGLILPIQDVDEALAANEMFKLEPTPERMDRITAKATLGSSANEIGTAPNWNSMRALRDPITGQVLRGAIGIYVDLAGRAVPVEIRLPDEFLKMSSTNPEDIRRRLSERAAAGTAR